MSSQHIDDILENFSAKKIGANSDWFVEYSTTRSSSFKDQLDRLRPALPPPPASILDVGAAPFVVSEALAKLGYNVTALDLKPERFENLHHLVVKVVKGDAEIPEAIVFDDHFDVILLSHVIEHFRLDLIGTLTGLKKLLKPNGILIVETPNLLSVMGWISLFRKGVAYSCAGSVHHEWSKLAALGHMGHVREYTAAEVSDLLGGVGFAIESIRYTGLIQQGSYKKRAIRLLQHLFPNLRSNLQITAKAKD